MATIRETFAQAPWDRSGLNALRRTQLGVMPTTSGAEFSARQLFQSMPASPDMISLAENTRRSRSARELFQRASARDAAADNALLSSATDDELASLFSEPRTEREARLQNIVQRDYNARERGNKFVWSDPQKIAFAQRLANLKRVQDENYFRPLEFELDQARFEEIQRKNFNDMLNQERQRQHAARALDSQNAFRGQQVSNAEANRNQRANQFGFTSMLQMEKFLQEKADEEARQSRGLYHDAARAAEYGAVPTAGIEALFGGELSPQGLEMVRGYARERERALAQEDAALRAEADRYNAMIEEGVDNSGGWLSSRRETPQNIAAPLVSQIAKNKNLNGRIVFNPATGKFVPQLSSAPASNPFAQSSMDSFDDEEMMGNNIGSDFAPPPAMPVAPQARPQTQLREGTRFIRNGTVFQIRGGQPVPLGAARR